LTLAALLDVNALIALVDRDHVGHDPMHRWFATHANKGWATCPITENGMIRVLSQPAYPSGQRSPAEAIQVLGALKTAYRGVHQFWADDVSLSDESLFDPAYIIGSRQVTDAYLLGLAARRKQRVVSFDRSLPWQAIRNGSSQLIQLMAANERE
jgi:toxin-antitoxin system PIN domain toxin